MDAACAEVNNQAQEALGSISRNIREREQILKLFITINNGLSIR